MKNAQPSFRIVAALAAALLSAQSIHAAPATWNNAAGGNWSVAGNWSPSGVPGTTSDVIFGSTGSGSPNTDDVSALTVNSLVYDWLSGLQQTTIINPGQTLTVTGSGAAGTPLLLAGSTVIPLNNTTFAPTAISGGGDLVVSGLGNIVVRIGVNSGAGAANHMATLDLSGLNNFTANAGRLLIGQALASETFANRPSGTLILAATNTITLSGALPQVMVQDGGQNANGGTASILTFGQVNFLNGDVMRLGGQKGNATINFNSALSAPSLKIRNADGVSPCTVIDFGYNAAVSTGNDTVMTADFTPGTVDLLANLVNIAQGPTGPNTAGDCAGNLTLGAGTVEVNNLEIGWGNATGASGITTGTLNANNSGVFPAGALVKVNSQLRLARTNSPAGGAVTGILNINGGRVQANTIVAGGGISTINLNPASPSSTLVVSNTTGTLAFPIRNFSMSDATLTIPALNGGASVAVSNLTVGGSANTINISSIPPIGSYPADFTLINYLSGYTAGTGPLSLGTLPTGGYSGTLVDVGGGTIKLHLTTGPVANLAMHWTGATDNNWDLTTFNWTFLAVGTNFFNGSSPLFDDNGTTQSNVFLATALSPGNITVSNNILQYSFVGSGNIAGAASLTKRGSKTLIVANEGVDTISTVVISSGTLQIGTNDLNGEISAISITNNSALVVNRSGTYALSAAIAGTGTLTKSGDGNLILSGANSYSGTTILNGGTLQIDGTSSGVGALTTSAGTVLAGSGTVNGPVTVGGQMNPGSASATGIFNANGGLTLSSGSTLNFDLSAIDSGNPAVNDAINVVGNLNVNNNKITVNFNGVPSGGTYTLFTYTGSLVGSFNSTIAGTHFSATLDTVSTPGSVLLNISGSGADLRWDSSSDSAWDAIATNWFNVGSSQPSPFFAGDSVLLDDTAGVVTGITIASGVNVSPSILTDTATNNSFSISGAGHITGSASIVKSGLGTLEISTANTFTGSVDVQRGTLRTGNASALGTAASGTTVQDGATLDLNGQNLGGEAVTITGAGDGGAGALVNNGGAAPVQALRTLILGGDATVGGTGLLLMNNSGGAASLTGGFSLTKVGANQFTLQNLTTVDAGLQNIHIQQGTMELTGSTPGMGDPAFTNTVEAGATLSLSQNGVTWNKRFIFNGNGVTTTLNVANSASPALDGSVELHGDCVFNVGGSSLTVNTVISGDGGLIKNGGSPLILNGVNTYTGDTHINTAALRLNGTASIANTTNVIIASGATLTVTGRVDSTFALVSGQALRGNGVVNGHVVEVTGSTIAPGVDAIGALTVSNTITLSGQTIMELDEASVTNDFLRCNSTITYGGTLNLVNLGGPLSAGASFKLFHASSYLGSFGSINPATPGPGQTWNTSALATTGTISVSGSATAPRFGSIALSGNNLVMSGSNGVPFATYYVLASTNVALPLTNWSRIATNAYNASGNFSFTNVITPAVPRRFFAIEQP